MLLLLFLCVVSSFILRVPNEEKYIYLLDNEKNLINQSTIVEYDNTFNLDNNVYYGNINNLHLSRFFCCYSSSLVDKKLTNDTNVYSNDNNLNIINLCNTSSFGLSKYFYSFSGLCFKKINLINTYTSFEDTNYIQILNPINLTNLFFGGNIFYNLSFPNYSIVCDNLTTIYQNINTTTNLINIDKNICYTNNTNITI